MAWATEPIRINGPRVHIRTYKGEDLAAIADAIHEPSGRFGINWGLNTPDKIQESLKPHLASQRNGLCNPLVYYVGSEIAGITRLMRIEPASKSLEIGGTWVAPKWRRCFVNTEVKFLLLRFCFESLAAERVEFRVDCKNMASQRAVAPIGAEFEGRLRNRQIYPNGELRDGLLFSVVKPDWEKLKMHLSSRLYESKPIASHSIESQTNSAGRGN